MAPAAPQSSTSPELKKKKSMSEKLKPDNLKKSLSKKMDKMKSSVDNGLGSSLRKLSSSFNSSKRIAYDDKSANKSATQTKAAPTPAPVVTYDAKVPASEAPAKIPAAEPKEVIAADSPVKEVKVVDEPVSTKGSVTPPTPPAEEAKSPEVEAPKEVDAPKEVSVSPEAEPVMPRNEAADEEGVAYEAVAEAAELAKASPPAQKRPIMKVAGVVAAVGVGIFFGVIGPLTASKPAPPPPPPKKKGFFF